MLQTQRSLEHDRDGYVSEEQLAKCRGYGETKFAALQLLERSQKRLPIRDYKAFFSDLEVTRGSQPTLTDAELTLLAKTGILASLHPNQEGSLRALGEWSKRGLGSLTRGQWRAILGARIAGAPYRIIDHIRSLELAIELSGGSAALPMFKELNQGRIDLSGFNTALSELIEQEFARRFPDQPISQVLPRFAPGSQGIHSALPETERERIGQLADRVCAFGDELRKLTEAELGEQLKGIRAQGTRGQLADTYKVRLLAICRDVMRRHFKINPFSTQILVVLGLIEGGGDAGRLVQVKTGEGKSTIVALLAAYMATLGHEVDVISSNRPLALRDFEKYTPYYDFFGVTTSHVCTNNPSPNNFSGQVCFGTNYDFKFGILRDWMFQSGLRERRSASGAHKNRSADIVIVDEIDNMLIDQGTNGARIVSGAFDPQLGLVAALYEHFNVQRRA